MIRDLVEAARAAREASTVTTSRRTAEVLITEEGLVVRGRYRDARFAFAANEEVDWPTLEARPRLAFNTVQLVIRRLEEQGEDLGIIPVRRGE